MKSIPLREEDGLKSADLFRAVLQQAPNGINVAQIRARCRVLDALDARERSSNGKPDAEHLSKQPLLLEDADHATLRDAIERFQLGLASRALLRVIDDVINAGMPVG